MIMTIVWNSIYYMHMDLMRFFPNYNNVCNVYAWICISSCINSTQNRLIMIIYNNLVIFFFCFFVFFHRFSFSSLHFFFLPVRFTLLGCMQILDRCERCRCTCHSWLFFNVFSGVRNKFFGSYFFILLPTIRNIFFMLFRDNQLHYFVAKTTKITCPQTNEISLNAEIVEKLLRFVTEPRKKKIKSKLT